MKNLKRLTIVSLMSFLILTGTGILPVFANDNQGNDENKSVKQILAPTLDMHISGNGKVNVSGAKVTAISGDNISASSTWGSANISWSVLVDSKTRFLRRFNGGSGVGEVSVGDSISFQGMLDTGVGSPFTVHATMFKDWSIQKQNATFGGTVKSVDVGNQSFVLASENRGDITVLVNSSAQVMKGSAVGVFADITVGARASATGVWDTVASKLTANKVVIRVTAIRTTVEGKLKSTSPLVVTVNGIDYTVNVASNTAIINATWLNSALSAFSVGDTLRVYGNVNSNATIDATVIRDVNLH